MNITGHFNSTVSHARDFIDVCTGLGDRWERTSARLTSLAMKTLGAMSYALAAWDTTVAVICLGSGASIPVALLYFALAAIDIYFGGVTIDEGSVIKEFVDPGSYNTPYYKSARSTEAAFLAQERGDLPVRFLGFEYLRFARA